MTITEEQGRLVNAPTVWVVMGSDFPDSVWEDEAAAEDYSTAKNNEDKNKKKHGGSRIYYRVYGMKVHQTKPKASADNDTVHDPCR